MKILLKYLNSLDRKAFFVSILLVGLFILYVCNFSGDLFMLRVSNMMSGGHQASRNSDIFCSKKENSLSPYCSDRRAAINDKWKEVIPHNQKDRKTAAFSLTR